MTYEYICNSCVHQWEADQSIKDEPISICPGCKAESVKRLISNGSFILCGGGWASSGYNKH